MHIRSYVYSKAASAMKTAIETYTSNLTTVTLLLEPS